MKRLIPILSLLVGPAFAVELEPIPHPDLSETAAPIRDFIDSRYTALNNGNDDVNEIIVAQRYGELGQLYQAHEFRDAAATAYRNAIALGSQDARWPYLLAFLYREAGKFDDAIVEYRRSLEIRPGYAPAQLRLGRVFVDQRLFDEATEQFESLIERDPQHAAAYAELAAVAIAEQRYEDARRYLDRALLLQPDANKLNHQLGLVYRQLGEVDKARESLQRAGARNVRFSDPVLETMHGQSRSAAFYGAAGVEAVKSADYAEAEQLFRQALEIEPESLNNHVYLARTLEAQGYLSEAKIIIDEALEIDPEDAKANLTKGVLLEEQHQPEAARAYYARALSADPDYAEALLYSGNDAMRRDEYEQAKALYERFRVQFPNQPQAAHFYGLALLLTGECEQAKTPLWTALIAVPDNPAYAEGWLRAFSVCPDDDSDARTRARTTAQSLYQYRQDGAMAATLAMVLAALGQFDDAIGYQGEAIFGALSVGDPEVLDWLKHNLQRYENEQHADTAWPDTSPLLRPYLVTPADRYQRVGVQNGS